MASTPRIAVSIASGWAVSSKISDEFKKHFFRYMLIQEGFRLDVYKDIKGYPTVGLGHLCIVSDGYEVGDVISPEVAMSLFEYDYKRLRIPELTQRTTWWGIPQKLGVASFIWSHGYGEYINGATQRLLEDRLTTQAQAQEWVKRNWDVSSPANQVRNAEDIRMFYTGSISGPGGYFFFDPFLNESFYSPAGLAQAKAQGKTGKPGTLFPLVLVVLLAILLK